MKLPKKPSKLIRLALDDLRKVERSKKYVVDMDDWHLPGVVGKKEREVCYVCLAGAVMAKRLDAQPDKYRLPNTFSGNEQALLSLNNFREGSVYAAFVNLELNEADAVDFDRHIVPYSASPKQFHKDMRELAMDLEKAGY